MNKKSVHIVVQRNRSCQVLLHETDWVSLGSLSSNSTSPLTPIIRGSFPRLVMTTSHFLSLWTARLCQHVQDNTEFTQYKKCSFGVQHIQLATSGNGVQNGVVSVNAPMEISSCSILGDCQDEIIAATERQLGIRTGSLDSLTTLSCPTGPCLGKMAEPSG
jgi:hypothetical protein